MPAIVPKTSKQCRDDYAALIRALVDQWWGVAAKAANGGCGRPYIVGRRGRDTHNCAIWAEVSIQPEARADWGEGECYLHPEPLPLNATREQIRELLYGILNREPLYVFAD